MQAPQFTLERTATGYWMVKRGAVHLASSMTRKGAEAERELLQRLERQSEKRATQREQG